MIGSRKIKAAIKALTAWMGMPACSDEVFGARAEFFSCGLPPER